MQFGHGLLCAGALVGLLAATSELSAQQVNVRTPFNIVNNSFYEQNSVSWSGHWGGATFQFGNPALANPQFGGYQPGAGLSTGIGYQSGNFQANLTMNFGQGSSRSIVSQTPSVTVMNGQTGYMSDTSQTPFVVSLVPVVGGGGPMLANVPMMGCGFPGAFPVVSVPDSDMPIVGNSRVQQMLGQIAARQQAQADGEGNFGAGPAGPPLNAAGPAQRRTANDAPAAADGPAERFLAAQESSAGRAAPSVAEARRLHEMEKAAQDGDIAALMTRARTAEEDGKPGVAKIYYQMVVKRASGNLKSQAQERLDALRGGASR